eukprot:gnl/TRDRNA2_/TRDRNA2_53393_c0_seq1.p1 gnl/TRDRNA2_/TRDRNA2_53393_c0~~gnl/TRDRNA2_/TRDRNA2_53393_c0_seq1.p1  ORF type:complete len:230 (-),score=41.33 gnl/TRDRNA2_/TRDRNA2_53393_c0_seq1:99-788(-)
MKGTDDGPSSLKVYWWDAPGRGGEPARLALTVAGLPFEDVRVSFTGNVWQSEHKHRAPWGKMPLLEVDGEMLAESGAILRYLAPLCKMAPESSWQQAKMDEFLDVIITDLEASAMFNGRKGDELVAARAEAAKPGSVFHEWLGKIDAKLAANESGFAVGDALTMADIKLFCETSAMVSGFYDGFPGDESLYSTYPHIQAHRTKIASIPAVKSYYAGRSGFYEAFARIAA